MKEITSDQNQNIKLAASLNTKQGRKKSSSFLIEGETLVKEALKKGIELEALYVLDESSTIGISVETFTIPENLMKKISTLETTPNMVAIAKQFTKEEPKENNFILYLEKIQDPGNLGTIIRTAFAAGVSSIYLSPGCADIYNPKTVRSTMGSLFYGHIKTDVKLEDLPRGYQTIASSPRGEKLYSDLKLKEKLILMIGNEANGLDEKTMSTCSDLVKIPMKNGIESVNASSAASILLFEISKKLN